MQVKLGEWAHDGAQGYNRHFSIQIWQISTDFPLRDDRGHTVRIGNDILWYFGRFWAMNVCTSSEKLARQCSKVAVGFNILFWILFGVLAAIKWKSFCPRQADPLHEATVSKTRIDLFVLVQLFVNFNSFFLEREELLDWLWSISFGLGYQNKTKKQQHVTYILFSLGGQVESYNSCSVVSCSNCISKVLSLGQIRP